MAQEAHIGYIGMDQRYWRRFKGDITDEYAQSFALNFYQFENIDTKDFPALIQALINRPCHILFVDFSDQFDLILKFTTTLQRLNCFKSMVLVGLFSMNEHAKVEKLAYPVGFSSLHLKSSEETRDAVYAAMVCTFPTLAKKPGTFNLSLPKGKDLTLFEVCRVNYVHANGMHLETCVPFKPNENISLVHKICPDFIRSQHCSVLSQEQGPFYYNSTNAAMVNFEFLDRIENSKKGANKMEQAHIADTLEKRANEVKKYKEEYAKWLEANEKGSAPKRTKLLIIDPTFKTIAQRDALIWDSAFSFRIQSHLMNPETELQNYRPDFVALEYCLTPPYAPPPPPATDDKKNKPDPKKIPFEQNFIVPPMDDTALQNIVTSLKKMSNYSPIIVIFGRDNFTSDQARAKYAYPKIVVAQGPISTHTLVDMAKTFDKKSVFFKDPKTQNLYFSKSDPLSFCDRPIPIKLMNITEFEIYFECDQPLGSNGHYKITSPVSYFVSIAPIPSSSPYTGRRNFFRGIIHLQSRQQIEELRKYIIKKDA